MRAVSDRTADILEAACRVIARDGADGLRMGQVAREAGVSSALIHYYFATRADLLLRAFAAVPAQQRRAWRVVVVGPHERSSGAGGKEFLDTLQQMAAQLQIDVDWVGPVFDREALNAIYRRARIFVYPSTAARGEALPLAPLEAMAQGCPVVTSDLLCFRDYLAPDVNGACFELGTGDPAERFSSALRILMADEALQRRYSAAGLATVQRFTLPRIADAFIDDFTGLHRG